MLTTNVDNSNNSNATNDKLNIYLHITGKAVKLIQNSKMNRRLIGEVNNNRVDTQNLTKLINDKK